MAKDDWECGRHSGIPDCCIEYFIAVWVPLFRDPAKRWAFEARQGRVRRTERRLGVDYQYIPCDSCLASGAPVVVLDCPPDCSRVKAQRSSGARRSSSRDTP